MTDALKVALLKIAQKKIINYQIAEPIGIRKMAGFYTMYGDGPQKAFNKLNSNEAKI